MEAKSPEMLSPPGASTCRKNVFIPAREKQSDYHPFRSGLHEAFLFWLGFFFLDNKWNIRVPVTTATVCFSEFHQQKWARRPTYIFHKISFVGKCLVWSDEDDVSASLNSSMCMIIRQMCYTGVQQLLPAVFIQPLDVKADRAKDFTETTDINI